MFWRRVFVDYRRPLAAFLAMLTLLAAVAAVRSGPSTVPVAVAAQDVPSGTVLTAEDVTLAEWPEDHGVAATSPEVDALVGSPVAGPVGTGEPLTGSRLLRPGVLEGYPSGSVLSTIRLAEADAMNHLRVGDTIDVVGVDPHGESEPAVVAEDVAIAALPPADDEAEAPVAVVTGPDDALALTSAGLSSRLVAIVPAD